MSVLEIEAERAQLRLLFLFRLMKAEHAKQISRHFYFIERPLSKTRLCVPVRVIYIGADTVLSCPSFCLPALLQIAKTGKEASCAALLAAAAGALRPAGLRPLQPQPRRRVLFAARSVPSEDGGPVWLTAQTVQGLENRTGVVLSDSFFRAGGMAYAMCRDNTMLSVAVSQPPRAGAVAREIGCATAPQARGHGYAACCVRALARTLCAEDGFVIYRADAQNAASLATARAAGLCEIASLYNPAMKRGEGERCV